MSAQLFGDQVAVQWYHRSKEEGRTAGHVVSETSDFESMLCGLSEQNCFVELH